MDSSYTVSESFVTKNAGKKELSQAMEAKKKRRHFSGGGAQTIRK
jgi:hypothetical protein